MLMNKQIHKTVLEHLSEIFRCLCKPSPCISLDRAPPEVIHLHNNQMIIHQFPCLFIPNEIILNISVFFTAFSKHLFNGPTIGPCLLRTIVTHR